MRRTRGPSREEPEGDPRRAKRVGRSKPRAGPRASGGRGEPDGLTTLERILDEAERLAQTRGFNGFSYADIARVVGTTKAALHYHFATKAELGRALITRYAERFNEALAAIDASDVSAPERLQCYARLYADVLGQGRLCLCGILAAEYPTLPDPMRSAVRTFFDRNEAWLSDVLTVGRDAGTLSFEGVARDSARALLAGLEGAMLLARAYGDPGHFETATACLLRELMPSPRSTKGARRRRRA